MIYENKVIWFITGSQHLYGEDTLKQVADDSKKMVEELNKSEILSVKIEYKPVVTTSREISKTISLANADEDCIGIITWMHTFSPSKMWINGLSILQKPLLHFHTQFNRDIPWEQIDMDFMNLNQSAHGDREHGFINTRMNIKRKVVVGHFTNKETLKQIDSWMRASMAYCESHNLVITRFGDNMREVAVTEGDKVEAHIKLGWTINGFGIGDLVSVIDTIKDSEVNNLYEEYKKLYILDDKNEDSIKVQARFELGMKKFLDMQNSKAFTTTFENLYGMKQLPGLAVQRLMAQGYAFGGEGDWKTSGLLRLMKVMGSDSKKGTTFMEDYTYHLEPGNEMILGAHMLEVCPSVARTKPSIQVHPLSIGDREDPARLVFEGNIGDAVCASIIDLGNRFRLIVNEVNAIKCPFDMPKLPVARVMWKPAPSLEVAAKAWILAGGAHHTSMSFDLNLEHLEDLSQMFDIELAVIDKDTKIREFQKDLKLNEIYYR